MTRAQTPITQTQINQIIQAINTKKASIIRVSTAGYSYDFDGRTYFTVVIENEITNDLIWGKTFWGSEPYPVDVVKQIAKLLEKQGYETIYTYEHIGMIDVIMKKQ